MNDTRKSTVNTARKSAVEDTGRSTRPLNGALYRLEVTRLVRSRTLLLLVVLCGGFGVVGPLLAHFTKDLVEMAGPEIGIELPDPTAADALVSYLELVAPLGVLAVVLIAASALSVDSSTGRSTFYRSRVRSAAQLILPRFALSTFAAFAGFLTGALVAWGMTSLLYGPLSLVSTLLSAVLTGLYLAFAVAVVALVSTVARGVLPTVGISLGVLVAVLLVGQLPFLATWVPSNLLQAQIALSEGAPPADFGWMSVVTIVLTAVVLTVAVQRSGVREI